MSTIDAKFSNKPSSNFLITLFLHLLLLGLSSSLAKSPSANVLVHLLVDGDGNRSVSTRNVLNEPQHERVAPPGSVSVRRSLVTTKANLSKGSLDKVASVGDEETRAADLAHGGGNEMAQNKVDINLVISKLSGKSVAPLLEESLTTRVSGQKSSRGPSTERSHGQDETVLASFHNRSDSLGNAKSTNAVDGDDILELLLVGLEERNRDAVALADVVDEDANIKTVDKLA